MGTGSLAVGTEAINASTLLLLFVKFIIAPRIVFFLPEDVGVATADCVDAVVLLAATVLDAVVVAGALTATALVSAVIDFLASDVDGVVNAATAGCAFVVVAAADVGALTGADLSLPTE